MSVSQADFTRAMMDAGQPVPDGLTDHLGQPAGRRFSVYRNNVAVSLTEAMHSAFPVIAKLLGKQNMDGLAGIYLRQHPPSSSLMMFYGEHFPAFLEGMEQLRHLGYLGDVARLELALRRAYHAADAAAIAPEALGALPPDALLDTRLELAPAVQVLRSPWPVHAIWRFNTEDGAPKPAAQAEDVLITRPEFDPIPQLLPPAGAVWVRALMAGATIGAAMEQAAAEYEAFDLSAPLALLLQGGAVTGLNSKG
ncbi:DNA-binding domain-containing protein [Leisingera aquaemixtae]|uniref:DNA-binding domain-containing protein n=1 Tax=Leisingera aquaemixtae TaxID=1396826 RepID=A0ABY5WMG8_9RHOB|nr:DNA-binding domain-containing protein [Leisingera aquaemixtae]UWQ42706.1 DNA-binding domain-containing protein [Leisingera aquaemixtae]